MNIKELQLKLLEAYNVKNMNNISLTLINLYKNRQYSTLQKITEIISDFFDIKITADGKGFSRLIMLYHPDRVHYYENEINKLAELNDIDKLLKHSHILKLEGIEEIADSLKNYADIDYSPVYEWDLNTDGFSIINDYYRVKDIKSKPVGYDFYDAVKIRQFGNTETEFPSYYLEDIDEFELSSSGIIDLEGVQFCIHAKILDLSDNRIVDLPPLNGLTHLEELNLSDNEIGEIDTLSGLIGLKSVNLSNNRIVDISPLFELDELEYAGLSGNKISLEQINTLTVRGVKVDY